MKTTITLLLLSLPFFFFAQDIDTAAIEQQVDSLILETKELIKQKQLNQALENLAKADALIPEILGTESKLHFKIYNQKGVVFLYQINYVEAEKSWLRAKDILMKLYGKEDENYMKILYSLSFLYRKMGDYNKAEDFVKENLKLKEKVYGVESQEYTRSLYNLANICLFAGKYEKSETYYKKTLAIQSKILGEEHLEYARCLTNLSIVYWYLGNYEKAETTNREVIIIWEKKFGKEHPDYLKALNNLALIYLELGDYEKVEKIHHEVLATREKVLGKEHQDYTSTLNNLGVLYKNLGNMKKAERYYKEALSIIEKVDGKKQTNYAEVLNNLGVLYKILGDNEKAEKFYKETLLIQEKLLGKNHPEYAESLSNLGLLYNDLGEYTKAEPLFKEAIAILENNFGKEHISYALNLSNLALLYSEINENENAAKLYEEIRIILEQVLGKEHFDYAKILYELVILYEANADYDKVASLSREISKIENSLLIKSSKYLSENELSEYSNKFKRSQGLLFSFNRLNADLADNTYDHILFYKGFLLNTSMQVKKSAQKDSSNTELYNNFQSYQRRLAEEFTKPISIRKDISQLEIKADSLEKELVRNVSGYSDAIRQVKWEEVQMSLENNEAAIEFVYHRYFNPKSTDSTMYAALVLLPGDKQPHFIPLFEETDLANTLKSSDKDQQANLTGLYSRGFDKKKNANLQGLYNLIWEPLDSLLQEVETVYYSPSGLLHRINLDAVPISKKERLGDKYQLNLLNSTRNLVIPNNVDILQNDAVIYGGIQYENPSLAKLPDHEIITDSTITFESSITFNELTRDLRGGSWKYLSGTEKETSRISTLLSSNAYQVELKQETSATEEAFKLIGRDAPSPRVLHIATHGFFFPDPVDTLRRNHFSDKDQVFKLSDNPMIRSGLILAGANLAWQGNQVAEGDEDGILTAYEIAQMDLSNTELVVLSACETGLGDIEGNEGVYGLQRAFKIAGAKYLIMSLWQVPDLETQEFMTTFYQEWLGGKTIRHAFRDTQKLMRELNEDPFYWAGFVLIE